MGSEEEGEGVNCAFSELSCGDFFRSSISRREGVYIKIPQNSIEPALINIWVNAMRVLPDLGVVGFGPSGLEYFRDEMVVERVYFRFSEVRES